jgi:hypothetical protein
MWLAFFVVAAFAATLLPVLLVPLMRWLPPQPDWGPVYLLVGLLAIAGAIVNFIVMLASHMTFGFGVSNSGLGETSFIWIIPVFQIVFALVSILVGLSTRVAAGLAAWLG